uniref:proline--tRNA ligase n=1 Tax=Chromera velia CCMP2878 TaxID=1169474 RepID=A0A0G4FJG8_9ALVE|mmetsp:Transcript_5464/g.10821  ORF Transcript_5464/g.10821 Transcript_5464/m.10821 type:complete len:716 (-) Transcript_5464:163-2310(-)|eukprot:Cvel_17161.t1-p1 / transcript=Cvel_17161.t1 / gene=Cvel_17161 / organism=Chromera_velia_CCMP2878 / gene_product=Proline--tRNA ligase, putative / transcript_product=Proline--tRNA ligase, putative / location=Cvel_scaffold1356:19307-28091(+) / protein_length=715 / sequence_SO=supercontig / SO=protein_coding / is_pseudo=false
MTEGYEAPLFSKLAELGIQYQTARHEAVFTVDAQKEVVSSLSGGLTKNLFLKDKKKGFFLVTALHDSDTNMKALQQQLGAANLRFADAEVMTGILKVEKGAVSPVAIMNDAENQVTLALDAKMKSCDRVLIHPLHNQATISIAFGDLMKCLSAIGKEPVFLELGEAGAAPPAAAASAPKPAPKPKAKQGGQQKPEKKKADDASTVATDTSDLGITVKKHEDFSAWYQQVITKSGMISFYDVSGCYILWERAFFIWEQIQAFFDAEIKKLGVKNAYFPMFVKKARLEAEKDHVEGFSPEVAWVTKSGDSDLAEPIAIRPTSETIMYPAYADRIRSHRDLPVKLNQWTSVVRWEFKHPTPFIRTREFLWQEGHTAHATNEEAEEMMFQALDLYERVYREILSVPVEKGMKSEGEKFPGGKHTSTVEAFIPANGRGVQAATSHHLGQNFSKMFNIYYEDESKQKSLVHQTSWGITTRSIGVMVMTHSDDKGLVLPPKVAPEQVVFIPILYKDKDADKIIQNAEAIYKKAQGAGIRAELDARTNYNPGWKFNHWEVKGVPIRCEVGPRDVENGTCRLVRRDTGEKVDIQQENLVTELNALLEKIQQSLFDKAAQLRQEGIAKISTFAEVMPALNNRKCVLAPWCEEEATEDEIKKETQRLSEEMAQTQAEVEEEGAAPALTGAMKTLCIPLNQPEMPEGTKCFWTGKPAKSWTLWGRSY